MLFDQLRSSLRGALDPDRSPGDRRAAVAAMRDALVAARVGVDDLRRGLDEVRGRVDAARTELETTRRRGRLAADVHDAETVAVAERFAASQAERVGVLEAKVDVQTRELALAERELTQMTAEYRRLAATGQMDASPGGEAGAMDARDAEAPTRADPDALLAALKRRMGK
ncbi:hypothetical protein tb265_33450 [Gemmatimonadetes bacterium T265]|nr:hypothetical protein tb265_33450 [Gemmatimonadetes bacterium T265]